jgi:hypothetical protein
MSPLTGALAKLPNRAIVHRLFGKGIPAMPTIARKGRYRFYFYSHEPNEPPHVHVDGGGASAKIWLVPIGLARNSGFRSAELAEVMKLVSSEQTSFLEAWHGYFGTIRR